MNVRGNTAAGGRDRENGHAEEEDSTATKEVAQCPSDKNQRTQKQTIRLDHPLHIDHGCVKTGLDRRQSDIDDSAVNEGQAGAENSCGEDPRLGLFSTLRFASTGLQYRFIARRSHGDGMPIDPLTVRRRLRSIYISHDSVKSVEVNLRHSSTICLGAQQLTEIARIEPWKRGKDRGDKFRSMHLSNTMK